MILWFLILYFVVFKDMKYHVKRPWYFKTTRMPDNLLT